MSNSRDQFKQDLRNLPKKRSVLFCIHIIKRLLPNYKVFYQKERFGDIAVLENVLDVAYRYFSNINLSSPQLKALKERLLSVAPGSENYPSLLSSYALDACAACDDLLSLIGLKDTDAVIRVSELSINTVYLSVLDNLNIPSGVTEYPDEEIYNSNQMVSEYEFQDNLLKRIITGEEKELIEEAFDIEYSSNIGLS